MYNNFTLIYCIPQNSENSCNDINLKMDSISKTLGHMIGQMDILTQVITPYIYSY